MSWEMANAAIDIWPDEAIEAMHLAALALLERAGVNNVFYAVAERPWDADALDVEATVDGVLSGRGFLGTRHTRRYIRSEFVAPLLSYRGGLNEWLASGRGGVVDLAGEKVADIVGCEPAGLPDDPLAGAVRAHRELRRRDRGARVPGPSPRARAVD